MDCPKCGNEISERAAFCTQCGASLTKGRNRARSVLKWGGVGCGGLLLVFIVVVIVAGLTTDSRSTTTTIPTTMPNPTSTPTEPPAQTQTMNARVNAGLTTDSRPTTTTIPTTMPNPTSTPTEPPAQTQTMNARVNVWAGAVVVLNNDTFPWYGIIVTVDDEYSTSYHFGDPNYGFLRPSSVVEPGELSPMSFSNLINSDRETMPGEPFVIPVINIKLKATTLIDGPYDLTYEITTKEANATKIPEQPETLTIYRTNPHDSIYIKSHKPYYEEAKALLADYSPSAFGSYTIPAEAFEEMKERFIDTDPYTVRTNREGLLIISLQSDRSLLGLGVSPRDVRYEEIKALLEKEADRIIQNGNQYIVPDDIMNVVSPSYREEKE